MGLRNLTENRFEIREFYAYRGLIQYEKQRTLFTHQSIVRRILTKHSRIKKNTCIKFYMGSTTTQNDNTTAKL